MTDFTASPMPQEKKVPRATPFPGSTRAETALQDWHRRKGLIPKPSLGLRMAVRYRKARRTW